MKIDLLCQQNLEKPGAILNKAEYPFNGDTENIKLTVQGAEIKEIKSRSMHIITKCYYQ